MGEDRRHLRFRRVQSLPGQEVRHRLEQCRGSRDQRANRQTWTSFHVTSQPEIWADVAVISEIIFVASVYRSHKMFTFCELFVYGGFHKMSLSGKALFVLVCSRASL